MRVAHAELRVGASIEWTRVGEGCGYVQRMRTRVVIFGAVIALVVAACGESDDNRQSSPTTTAASSPTTTAGTSAGSTGLQVGDRVTSKGTQLRAPSNPDTRQIDS